MKGFVQLTQIPDGKDALAAVEVQST